MNLYIGIDIGTSSVKTILINESGTILSRAEAKYSISEPYPGWREIDPNTWFEGTLTAIKELVEGHDGSQVCGIGITGQMHTLVTLNKDGDSIRPAIMWNDTRTESIIPFLRSETAKFKDAAHISSFISTGSPAAALKWISENEPNNFNAISTFLIGPDYIVYRLCGSIGTDYCEASTSSLYDLEHNRWSDEMRALLGISEAIYPPVNGCCSPRGKILPELAERLNISPEATIITGTGDNPATAIATGCLSHNYPVLSLGTSGILMFSRTKTDFSKKGKNILFSFYPDKIHVMVQGAVQACGNSITWWTDNILSNGLKNLEKYDKDSLGENALLFYPHLTGDKTIYHDPTLRGSFIGLSTATSPDDMTVAVMEGIAFAVKQLAHEMGLSKDCLSPLRVVGGGSRSDLWLQILSDVLDAEIIRLEANSDGVYAMAAISIGPDFETLLSVKESKRFFPRNYNVNLYNKKYKRYLKIHDALKCI